MHTTKKTTKKVLVLEAKELIKAREFINDCQTKGFTGINNFVRINQMREFFFGWHLQELAVKLNRPNRKGYLTVTSPEIETLKAMFQRVEADKLLDGIIKKLEN